MTIHCLRVSVGRSWRFTAAGEAAADQDYPAYRHRLDALKSTSPPAQDYGLPWPVYRSRFWQHMLNDSYQNTKSPVLVAALLPLVRTMTLEAPPGVPSPWTTAEVEAVRHPFGITTLVHLDLSASTEGPAADGVADLLRATLTSDLTQTDRVQDGVPVTSVPPLPRTSAGGHPIDVEDVGGFTVISALHAEPDGRASASALSLRLDDEPRPDDAAGLRSTDGAVCVTGDTVGLALPSALPRAGQRVRCLHHNYALLLAYMNNLAALVSTTAVPTAEWYQTRAAVVLNHLHRREPLPETASIYRSRLPELWMARSGALAARVNTLAPGLPPLTA